MIAIEVENITKDFKRGQIRAVDEVSLSVEEGTTFGLLGPNGAGKTTLVKMLLGILFPTSGRATLFGRPAKDHRVRERVGYLPENHQLPDFLTGEQSLHFYARLAGVEKSHRVANAGRLLKLVNLEDWKAQKTYRYSKGMRQRLGLAQAMMSDPDLLFLDEPTEGLDPIGRKEIRDILLALKEEGKTIFLNSHLLSEVEMLCDEVAILDKGALVKRSTVKELTSQARTYRITTSRLSQKVLDGVQPHAQRLEPANGFFRVAVKNQKQLNAIIDYLRAEDIDIKSIVPEKRTLEESFIKIIKPDHETAVD